MDKLNSLTIGDTVVINTPVGNIDIIFDGYNFEDIVERASGLAVTINKKEPVIKVEQLKKLFEDRETWLDNIESNFDKALGELRLIRLIRDSFRIK